MAGRERKQMSNEERNTKGTYKDRDAVPKEGTKLTPERIGRHYRSLNPEKRDQAGAS
jgi:hypothetical protein